MVLKISKKLWCVIENIYVYIFIHTYITFIYICIYAYMHAYLPRNAKGKFYHLWSRDSQGTGNIFNTLCKFATVDRYILWIDILWISLRFPTVGYLCIVCTSYQPPPPPSSKTPPFSFLPSLLLNLQTVQVPSLPFRQSLSYTVFCDPPIP